MDMYRKILIENVGELMHERAIVFTQILNLAMFGEMKEINNQFETGETFQFELAHFEDLTDANVQKLISLFKKIDQTILSLINLNAITNEELERYTDFREYEP